MIFRRKMQSERRRGKILFPGFIDGHTHFDLEVAGTVTADDFETGTKAAILGELHWSLIMHHRIRVDTL